jgi:hypothetical protein
MAQMRATVKAAWILGGLGLLAAVIGLVNKSGTSKVNLNNPTFNAPTQVGDNNTQTIATGPTQRNVSEEDIKFISSNIPDTIKEVYLLQRVDDSETNIYSKSIDSALKTRGYKTHFGGGAVLSGPERTYPDNQERNEKAKHIFQFDTAGKKLFIYVPLHQ